MILHLNVHKAVQAAGVLLRMEGNRMSYLRLLKLLYIADREALRETGMPILGCKAVAMRDGPLHSDIYNLIKGIHQEISLWGRFFCTQGYKVEVVQQPDIGLLSKYEINTLQEVAEKYAPFTDFDICHDMTHSFGEWKENYQEGTSRPIQIEDIIKAVGRGGDTEAILDDLRELEEMDKILGEA